MTQQINTGIGDESVKQSPTQGLNAHKHLKHGYLERNEPTGKAIAIGYKNGRIVLRVPQHK